MGFQSGIQSFVSGLVGGVATFLVATATVTTLVADHVDISLAIGLPTGLAIGALVGGKIYRTGSAGQPVRAQRLSRIVVGFSVGFLVVFFTIGSLVELGPLFTVALATGGGIVIALILLSTGGSDELELTRPSDESD